MSREYECLKRVRAESARSSLILFPCLLLAHYQLHTWSSPLGFEKSA